MTHRSARAAASIRSRAAARTGAALFLAACFVLAGRADASKYDQRKGGRMPAGNGYQTRGSNKAFGAPEVDASLAAGGIILLVGGTLVLMHSRKTRPA